MPCEPPSAATAACSRARRPDDLAAHVVADRGRAHRHRPARDRRRLLRRAPTRPARTTATSPGWPSLLAGLPIDGAGRHRQPALRLRPRGGQPGGPGDPAGEGDVVPGRRRRVDEPRAVGHAEAASGLPARQPQTMHDTALGWRFVNPRMEELLRDRVDGRDRPRTSPSATASPASEQDAFALRSHQRAVAAAAAGRFDDEIVPVEVPSRKGGAIAGRRRRGPARRHPLETLGKLRPVFREGGTVTAGNASTAQRRRGVPRAAPREQARRARPEPLARVVAIGVAGVDPAVMGIGPVPAIRKALDARRPRARRHRPDRAQRGVRRAGARLRRASSASTRSASTSTAARSRSAIRSAAPAPGC